MARPTDIRENVPLAPFTTYRIGGPARYYARPATREALADLLVWAHREDIPGFILGAGSNLLVSDRGYPGLVIHLQGFLGEMGEPSAEGIWEVGAGTGLFPWVRRTARRGWAGVEALIGIPGTLGGALRMNAGAFNQEISQVLERVELIRTGGRYATPEPQIIQIQAAEAGFAYRKAPGLEGTVILSARFRLQPGDPEKLMRQVREVVALRRNRQPLQWPSCGSVFKRPPNDFAGRLIEAAGFKGFQLGGAQVSPRHAGFILNTGGATAADVLNLIKRIIQTVRDNSGVTLEREVILVGFDDDELAGT
ncbi:MAG: UDP-N-acetylmuramate dehydrogenase [Candidatus Zixiibacteriota bacterium]|nr:MAG: UDP-N-acetylmuramate dehydrogenase [candidate division Zixibacteria bacterium]